MVGHLFKGFRLKAAAADLYNTFYDLAKAQPEGRFILLMPSDWAAPFPHNQVGLSRWYQVVSEGNARTYLQSTDKQLQSALFRYNQLCEGRGAKSVVLVDSETIAELDSLAAPLSEQERSDWAMHVNDAFQETIRRVRSDAGAT